MIIDISSLISFLTPSKSGNTNWKNFSFSDFDPTSKVFLLKVGKKFATRYPNRNGSSLGWTLPRLEPNLRLYDALIEGLWQCNVQEL